MKRILITGAAGFVGLQIVNAYKNLQVQLLPVVREGTLETFEGQANIERVITSPDIFSESDIWWATNCKDVDIVIHAAWYAEPGKYLFANQNMDCLIGSLGLVKGAVSAGVKRIVGIGTCFEYELTAGVLSINTPLKPITPYAAAKAALYLGLKEWLPKESVEFSWCRLFYLHGVGEDERRLAPYIHNQLKKGEVAELTSGKQIRDFMDVSDAGKKIAEIALSDLNGPVNVCSGVPITVRQFAEQIAAEYGRLDLLHFGVRPENLVDPACVVGIPNY